jgi:hypothetical protein
MLRATPQLLSFRATPPVSFTTDAVAKPSLSRPGHKPHAQRRPSLDPMGVPRLHMAVAPGIRSGTALAGLDLGLYIRRNSAVSTGCSPVFAAFQHVCLLDRAPYTRRATSSPNASRHLLRRAASSAGHIFPLSLMVLFIS